MLLWLIMHNGNTVTSSPLTLKYYLVQPPFKIYLFLVTNQTKYSAPNSIFRSLSFVCSRHLKVSE